MLPYHAGAIDHRAFFSLQEWANKEKNHMASASTRQHAVLRPDRDRRAQGASREARARSAVPPSVSFGQPQTADGKPTSGQAAAGQTQTQLDRRFGVERHPEKGRARRAGGERGAARRSSGGAAAEAQRSLCGGRSSSRTIDEEMSKRENENEAEKAITFRIRRGHRAAGNTSPPCQMRFVGRWRHLHQGGGCTHHARVRTR